MRKPARRLAAACIALSAVTVAGADELGWHGYSDADITNFFYGIPDSGDFAFSFACQPGSPNLAFTYLYEPADAVDGAEKEVRLRAGDIEVAIATVGYRSDMDDLFFLEGQTVLDARLSDLITSRGTLRIFVDDSTEEYPLDGAREAAAPLIEKCRPA